MWLRHNDNIGVAHGKWGEDVAVKYLRTHGFEIVDRNPRPVERDKRLEIDIIAWDKRNDVMVFVEVKQHACLSDYARRMRSVNKRKKQNLRRACNAWRRIMKWQGSFRFDVIEIYGVPGKGQPIIDHISNERLFVGQDRFVKW